MGVMSSIFKAIVSICNVVCVTATAAEKAVQTVDNVVSVAEHASASYKHEAFTDMQIRKAELQESYSAKLEKLPQSVREQLEAINPV